MPQLDKLTFLAQIFWFFILFALFYYIFVQGLLFRLKFSLGLKRFFFQNEKLFFLNDFLKNFLKSEKMNSSLLFLIEPMSSNNIRSNNFLKEIIAMFSFFIYYVQQIFQNSFNIFGFEKYIYLLGINKNFFNYYLNNILKKKDLNFKFIISTGQFVSKIYFKLNELFSYFFKLTVFSIFELNFVLLYNFLLLIEEYEESLILLKLNILQD